MFGSLDIRVVGIIVAGLVLIAAETGFLLARRRDHPAEDDSSFGVVQGAAYALVGLLLGFSFSLAVSRYDTRRATVVKEANAIEVTALRADLLAPVASQQLTGLLRQYVVARIAFSRDIANVSERSRDEAQTLRLQDRMWTVVRDAAQRNAQSTTVPLVIEALNETIDEATDQTAALTATIPESVIAVLVLLVLIAVGMMGYGLGKAKRRRPFISLLLAAMFALVIATILDLDRPQQGLITVSLQPLTDLQARLDVRH